MCLGSLVIHAMNGGEKDFPARKWVMISFVAFMFLAFIGGFGLMARLDAGMQAWIYAKITLWLVVGGYMTVITRKPELSRIKWFVVLLLGATGAYLALYKPF